MQDRAPAEQKTEKNIRKVGKYTGTGQYCGSETLQYNADPNPYPTMTKVISFLK
jgi:hypothetical protein